MKRRVLVMGDMLELGAASDRLHREAVERALDAGIEMLVTVGPASRRAVGARERSSTAVIVSCSDCETASGVLRGLLAGGDIVWLKGSRRMGLERLVPVIEEVGRAPVREEHQLVDDRRQGQRAKAAVA